MSGPNQAPDFSGVDDVLNEEHYGSLPQQALAGIEGAARGATLNASDYALAKTGLTSLEDIRAREEANPATAIGGIAAGAAGLTALTGGLAAPLEEAALAARVAPLAARMAGFGAEGAAYGLGTNLVDTTLGDQKVNAQKIAADTGFGALLGAGLGALSHGIGARLGAKARAAAESVDEIHAGDLPEALGSEMKEPLANPNAVYDPPKTGIPPKSLEEIEARIKDAPYKGETTELPSADVLRDARSRIEMSNPILDMQLESTASQEGRNTYNIAKESGGKVAKLLNDYEALQKNELVGRTDRAIEELAGGKKAISDAVENGKKAIESFTDQYQAEKEALGPHFEALKNTNLSEIDHLPGILNKMTDAVPGVAHMFDTSVDAIKILPYKTKWGIDKSTYNAVKQAVESLDNGVGTFEELQNIRKGLDQNINILEQGQGPREVMALKKSMMDYMQDALEKNNHAFNVREIFKRYAINEQERGVIEKAFGASVGSPEFGAISKVKPEEILDKIFKNTATVKAAKAILSPESFSEMLANHLAEQRAKFTDKGIFSSNKFGSYLKKNQDVLNEAFANNQGALQKIKDLNIISRMIPDAAPINPSGTAKTLMGLLKSHSLPELASNLSKKMEELVHEKLYERKINQMLAGKAEQSEKMQMIQKIIKKTSDKIESGAKSIFNGGPSTVVAPVIRNYDNDYDKNVKKIQELSYNPQQMMDHLGHSSKELYAIAPNITGSLHNTLMDGVQFLAAHIPAPKTHMLFSNDFKPTPAQKYAFNSLFRIVDDPISVLHDVKSGDLAIESVQALQIVHPDLLKEMQKSIIDNYDPEKAKDLHYSVKMSLAKLLGEPLDEHMLPQVISSYQQSFMMPQPKQPGIKPTSKGIREIDKSERIGTRTNQQNET